MEIKTSLQISKANIREVGLHKQWVPINEIIEQLNNRVYITSNANLIVRSLREFTRQLVKQRHERVAKELNSIIQENTKVEK